MPDPVAPVIGGQPPQVDFQPQGDQRSALGGDALLNDIMNAPMPQVGPGGVIVPPPGGRPDPMALIQSGMTEAQYMQALRQQAEQRRRDRFVPQDSTPSAPVRYLTDTAWATRLAGYSLPGRYILNEAGQVVLNPDRFRLIPGTQGLTYNGFVRGFSPTLTTPPPTVAGGTASAPNQAVLTRWQSSGLAETLRGFRSPTPGVATQGPGFLAKGFSIFSVATGTLDCQASIGNIGPVEEQVTTARTQARGEARRRILEQEYAARGLQFPQGQDLERLIDEVLDSPGQHGEASFNQAATRAVNAAREDAAWTNALTWGGAAVGALACGGPAGWGGLAGGAICAGIGYKVDRYFGGNGGRGAAIGAGIGIGVGIAAVVGLGLATGPVGWAALGAIGLGMAVGGLINLGRRLFSGSVSSGSGGGFFRSVGRFFGI